eukprot:4175402-Pleurochrysis_carterae.AAC.1
MRRSTNSAAASLSVALAATASRLARRFARKMDGLVPRYLIAEFDIGPYVDEWLQLFAFGDARVIGITWVGERLACEVAVAKFAVH